jgi:hypothetical protein
MIGAFWSVVARLLVFWFVCIEVQESEKVLEASSFKRAT